MSVFSFGADPELFVKEKKTDKFVPAWGLVGGTKECPEIVEKGAVQVDGMALEFNINPAKEEQEFVDNVFSVKHQLGNMIGDHLKFSDQSTAVFDEDVWNSTPDEAKILGCDPDFNADTLSQNTIVDPPPRFRTAGGHIHIGWGQGFDVTNPDFMKLGSMVVKQLDASVGYYLFVNDPDKKRQELYGAPGAFRLKPYGVEYRSPSNWWIREEEYAGKIFRMVKKSVEDLSEGIRYNAGATAVLATAKKRKDYEQVILAAIEQDKHGVYNV